MCLRFEGALSATSRCNIGSRKQTRKRERVTNKLQDRIRLRSRATPQGLLVRGRLKGSSMWWRIMTTIGGGA